MASNLLIVYVHIMTSIFWIGNVMFWALITGPVQRRFPNSSAVLRTVNEAPWPPRQIPTPIRLRFSQVAWVCLGVLVITGALLVRSEGITLQLIVSGQFLAERFGQILVGKLALVAILLAAHLRMGSRPVAWLANLNMGLAVAVVVLSVILARWVR